MWKRESMHTLIGTKLGMTQILGEGGVVIPITVIAAGPCTVTQVKSLEHDGYNAVQLGYGSGKNLSNAVAGHVIVSMFRELARAKAGRARSSATTSIDSVKLTVVRVTPGR